jgi:hypothetical protein
MLVDPKTEVEDAPASQIKCASSPLVGSRELLTDFSLFKYVVAALSARGGVLVFRVVIR